MNTTINLSYEEQANPPTDNEVSTLSDDFMPLYSTDVIFRGGNEERCLTDDLDAMDDSISNLEENVANLENSKAFTNHTHTQYALTSHTHSNKADLVDGKVPASELPSYVDDVVDAYIVTGSTALSSGWLSTTSGGTALTPESGKVYIVLTDGSYQNKTYRWSGTVYVQIGSDLAIGETASTAFRGDHGKTAYEHTQDSGVHVTSDEKSTWNSKASSDHNHDTAYVKKALQFTNDIGGVEFSFGASSGKNLLTEMASWTQGVHTAYSASGITGNPNSTEAFRIMVHKTAATIGWVVAFGSSGSVFTNYQNTATTFRGWRRIYDVDPEPLWVGTSYMNGEQSITISKKLSECQNGWMLEWCDFDASTNTANNFNYVQTPVYKRNRLGDWVGQNMMFALPVYIANDGTGAVVTIKQLIISDDTITGHVANGVGANNQDVVLRAVYEF